ncbi:amino acid permease [Acidipropionibacterium virtanenii]|uniref:D-serine/D-alanine/glycine transporter n=1 Tax=Acidipropionibacterium virtanenii TaxID=2057246 RepID=A0A344UQL6_9ACTN|nr:amino acid permease [Acidipropionibacterium virtanenii]AXE37564.1 D-serine/D-alanine/glycine transporter [Acidipropionibacterium virtanenii]
MYISNDDRISSARSSASPGDADLKDETPSTKPEQITPHEDEQQLERGLHNRHLQLIAIGGAIGTGLFLGSGRTIHLAGPSILLVYLVIGFFLFFVMRAMGELLLSNLAYKSFADFTTDLVGKPAGFYIGWTYWMCWVVIGIADTTAICGYLSLWFPTLPKWIPALCVVLLLTGLNMVAVRIFGELEFWFAMIKIVTIIALILIGGYLALTAFQPPVSGAPAASFTHLWDRGGFFPTGFMGFLAGFQIAIFSFQGIEMAGTAAAETKDPEHNLPKAINSIPARVLIFYILALGVIMSVQPWDLIDPDQSPFVEMFGFIGILIAFHVINFVVLTSAASSANSGVFSTSRIMYGMAREKNAPSRFAGLSGRHVPRNALVLTALCISPAIVLVMLSDSVMDAFSMVAGVSSVLYISVWGLIMVAYLRYLKKFPERHDESIFPMPFGRAMSWATLVFFVAVLVALSLSEDTRIALFAAPVWILFMIVVYRALRGTRATAEAIDFDAERIRAREVLERERAAEESEG